MKSVHYERLFLLNRFLDHAAEIIEHFKQEKLIHPEYAQSRLQALMNIRADLSHVLTGLLREKELEECVRLAGVEAERAASRR